MTNAGVITADGGSCAYFQAGIVNNGSLTVSGVGTTVQTDDAVNNTGTIEIWPSSASLIIGGDLFSAAPGAVAADATTTIRSAETCWATRRSAAYATSGVVSLDGSGTAGSPQLLEAMSKDVGATVAGLDGHFALDSLQLGDGTYVQLVDQAVNTPGDSQPEAVYANELSVPADSTLDLNGLHLYVGTRKSPERW